jgi:hypothetical protein
VRRAAPRFELIAAACEVSALLSDFYPGSPGASPLAFAPRGCSFNDLPVAKMTHHNLGVELDDLRIAAEHLARVAHNDCRECPCHVFGRARASRLIASLSECPRPSRVVLAVPLAAAFYRASGFVL